MKNIKIIIFVIVAFICTFCVVGCNGGAPEQEVSSSGEGGIIETDVQTVKLNYSEKLIVLYDYYTLFLSGTDKKASWKSSDPSIVTVNDDGVIYGASVGNAVITATVDGKEYSCNVSVSNNGKLAVIRIDLVYDSVELDVDSSYTLTPVIIYNDTTYTDATFSYSGFDKSVINVSDNGVVTGLSKGRTEVTVSASWRSVSKVLETIVAVNVN